MAVAFAIPSSSLNLKNYLAVRKSPKIRFQSTTVRCSAEEKNLKAPKDEQVEDLGVRAALSMLKFYKREISPLLLSSCRYVPTCSEYSMEAYKKYGVVKGTILTAWRLCRCNPLGGCGFDPPRWFGKGNASMITDEQFRTVPENNAPFPVESPVKEDDKVI